MIRTFAGISLSREVFCFKHDAADSKRSEEELSNFDHVRTPCTFCGFVHKCRVLEACPRYCVRKFYFPIVCVSCAKTSYAPSWTREGKKRDTTDSNQIENATNKGGRLCSRNYDQLPVLRSPQSSPINER